MLILMSVASSTMATPPCYVAPRLRPGGLLIDGDLDKPEWATAPWSEAFEDIRGSTDAPPEAQPSSKQRTRMKMLWDDEYLYIGAMLESDFPVVAEFTERNSPIFQRDSDFEVFSIPRAAARVQGAGGERAQRGVELAAHTAVQRGWRRAQRPCRAARCARLLRGRAAAHGDASARGCSAVAMAMATAKEGGGGGAGAASGGATWTVEIALAHSDTLVRQPMAQPPADGVRWRINFSRVEKRGAVNWTWGPQVAWEPRRRAYEGKVNMHLPDCFGVVEFAPSGADPSLLGQRAAVRARGSSPSPPSRRARPR